MHVEWFGHSAFALEGAGAKVFVDPFADMSALADRGVTFEYPPVDAGGVDLVLVTHEHRDHNGVEAVRGEPTVLRAIPGRHASPHRRSGRRRVRARRGRGTERGPNTIFVFELGACAWPTSATSARPRCGRSSDWRSARPTW